MRRLLPVLLLAGCTPRCGGSVEVSAQPDAAVPPPIVEGSGSLLVRDRLRPPRIECPEGETRLEPFTIRDGIEAGSCGERCTQVTKTRGDGIRWYDVRGERLAYTAFDKTYVGVVDLSTGTEVGIPLADAGPYRLSINQVVAIDGSRLVFSTLRTDGALGGRLWLYGLETQCLRSLGDSASENPQPNARYVDLDGRNVVWIDDRMGTGRQDLFSYNLETAMEKRITDSGCCVSPTRIWGTQVIYEAWQDGRHRIYAVDLEGGIAERVYTDPREQNWPAIHGTRVVFEVQRRDPWDRDIHGVDLSTGEAFTVTESDIEQQRPDVHGDLIAWEDWRNDHFLEGERTPENVDIYALDLSTGEEVQVTSFPGLEMTPRIWGRTVFFRARLTEAGPIQVYAAELPE